MVTFGDSKTARREWQPLLVASLRSAGLHSLEYGDAARNGSTLADSLPGVVGTGVDHLISQIPAHLLHTPELIRYVTMNWGVNDMEGWPLDEGEWKMNYLTIIDWAHTLFPNAKVYLSYPWRGGYDTQAATMRGWIDDMMNQRYFLIPGVDEAVTIKRDDNGWLATDGSEGGSFVHYTVPFGVQCYADAMSQIILAQGL